MRIYGNREIKTLSGGDTRPTTSKVREAIFNIWRDRLAEASWLDLCAGNGTMGAEALCRGISKAVAIEKSNIACKVIRENWQKVSRSSQEFKILRGDVVTRLKVLTPQQFDLIYFDPPYYQNLYSKVLDNIVKYELLKPNVGELAVEYDPRRSSLETYENEYLTLIQRKDYGKTSINFYRFVKPS